MSTGPIEIIIIFKKSKIFWLINWYIYIYIYTYGRDEQDGLLIDRYSTDEQDD